MTAAEIEPPSGVAHSPRTDHIAHLNMPSPTGTRSVRWCVCSGSLLQAYWDESVSARAQLCTAALRHEPGRARRLPHDARDLCTSAEAPQSQGGASRVRRPSRKRGQDGDRSSDRRGRQDVSVRRGGFRRCRNDLTRTVSKSAWSTLWSTEVNFTHPRMTLSQLSHKKSPAKRGFSKVEPAGIEPATSCLQINKQRLCRVAPNRQCPANHTLCGSAARLRNTLRVKLGCP
jgi:hypothetical protein